MAAKQAKLLMVPPNGQISIGKSWAGRQILVEELDDNVIRISAGVFVKDSQKEFNTKKALASLSSFNEWEKSNPAKESNTKAFFSALKKKKKK